MNWLDFVILAVLLISLFLGLKIGLIKAGLSLAGLLAGIVLAGRYSIPLAQRLTFIPQAKWAEVVAFALIVIGAGVVAGLLAMLLRSVARAMMLGWIDRLGGAVFGLALGALLFSALLATWVKFQGMPQALGDSTLAEALLDSFSTVLALLPVQFEWLRSFFR